jgi:hypothetical protein
MKKLFIPLIFITSCCIFQKSVNAQSLSPAVDASSSVNLSETGKPFDSSLFIPVINRLDALVYRMQKITDKSETKFEKIRNGNKKAVKLNKQSDGIKYEMTQIQSDLANIKEATFSKMLASDETVNMKYSEFRKNSLNLKNRISAYINDLSLFITNMKSYEIITVQPTVVKQVR